MKIYNYTDLPVSINGVDITDREIYIDNTLTNAGQILHDGNTLLSTITSDRNYITTITNARTGTGYEYQKHYFETPNIFSVQIILLACFSFLFTIKLAQKLKTR